MEELTRLLLQGAENFGYTGDVWTSSRMHEIIEIKFDVGFTDRHVQRLMKRLGWTPQKPVTHASQKNMEEVKLWREQRWPDIKKLMMRSGKSFLLMSPAFIFCHSQDAHTRQKPELRYCIAH